MFLKKCVKLISGIMFSCLLAWFSCSYLRENGEDMLLCVWNHTFHRFGPDCIYWIAMRLAAWILVYLYLLRLESGFSVYLFLRQRSYGKVFLHTYGGCVGKAACYYGLGTLVMAIFYGLTSLDMKISSLLWNSDLLRVLTEEGLETLNFCLMAYVLHCLFRHAEAGFLTVLVARLLLNFATGGGRPALPVQLAVNLIMTGVVFLFAFRNFAENLKGGLQWQ